MWQKVSGCCLLLLCYLFWSERKTRENWNTHREKLISLDRLRELGAL